GAHYARIGAGLKTPPIGRPVRRTGRRFDVPAPLGTLPRRAVPVAGDPAAARGDDRADDLEGQMTTSLVPYEQQPYPCEVRRSARLSDAQELIVVRSMLAAAFVAHALPALRPPTDE